MRANRFFVVPQILALLAVVAFTLPLPAQDQLNATCTLDDGKQASIRYSVAHASQHLHPGKMWTPGDAPMYLFTQVDMKIQNINIPEGAYSLYIMPEKEKWTLIINKKVDASAYDAKEDIGRVDLGVGALSESVDTPRLAFFHAGPKQCNLRVNFEKSGAWGEFHEQ